MAITINGHDGGKDPFELVLDGREGQRGFCRDLEALADGLVPSIDEALAERCLGYIDADLPVHQRDEEAVYRLLAATKRDESTQRLIELAMREHLRHRDYAFEISDRLSAALEGRGRRNPDALGYLLRCMFDNLRQHLAWEEATLFGAAYQLRGLWSRLELAGELATNRRGHPARLRVIRPISGA